MEMFLLTAISIFLCTVLIFLFSKAMKKNKLPPGPIYLPVFGNLLWLYNPIRNFEHIVRKLHGRYGPIITLRIGTRPYIFVSDRHIAHKMLVENGAIFAARPPRHSVLRSFSTDDINRAPYGPLWRLLRRNLIMETLHPSRIKLFTDARSWVLSGLIDRLLKESNNELGFEVLKSFQFAMFSLLVFMCFGERLDEKSVEAIGVAQRDLLYYGSKLNVLAIAPFITKYLFRSRLKMAMVMKQKQKDIYIPLINERRKHANKKEMERESLYMHSYVDSLLDIKVGEEGARNLTEHEIVGLCSEFLNAGTDTTTTALQWIMAELVKHQEIQKKLFDEIEEVKGENISEEIKEEDLHKLPYLKMIILEGLRRHPPAHFVLPHAVTEETLVEGYVIPKKANVNFEVAGISLDEKIWLNPTEFKPERFMDGEGVGVDITGTREIKMMPFGAGRRICPGLTLALLHLEYFVGNLVKDFEWKSLDGEEVDLTEKQGFTVPMKYPLKAMIIPRRKHLVNV